MTISPKAADGGMQCCDGFVGSCPLCPDYGTRNADRCPGHDLTEANQTTLQTARLHAEFRHPSYEYRTTKGPRKQWDTPDRPPCDDNGDPEPGWEPNLDAGLPGEGWERFDYHEEAYWRRRKDTTGAQTSAGNLVFDAAELGGSLTIDASSLQTVALPPPPTIVIHSEDGGLLIAVHPDGRLEYGPGYEPDDAARRFWDGVQQYARALQYGTGLNASINAHLAAGQTAEEALAGLREQMARMCNCCATNRPHLRRMRELLGMPADDSLGEDAE